MLLLFELVWEHLDDLMAIIFGQFLKVLFKEWIEGWMKNTSVCKSKPKEQPEAQASLLPTT